MSSNSSEQRAVAVVGAGIVGLSIAWRLAQTGRPIVVFDRGRAGGEASWAGAGMLAPGGEVETDSLWARDAIEARRLYTRFVAELAAASGLSIDFQQTGALELAFAPEELARLAARAEEQQSLGISSKPLTAKQVAAFWPRVRTAGLAGGYFYPDDAVVDPRHITAALIRACQGSDVTIRENCEVRRVTVASGAVTVDCTEITEGFAAAVIAAGAWSNQIEVRNVPPLPLVEPVKGVLVGYRQPEQTCSTIVRHGHTYLLQRANGLLIAGASVEWAGFDREIRQSVVDTLTEEASFVFPHLSETSPTEIWAGFRPHAEQLHAGEWHSPRLLLAYGHYRNGILLAPLTAQRIAKQI